LAIQSYGTRDQRSREATASSHNYDRETKESLSENQDDGVNKDQMKFKVRWHREKIAAFDVAWFQVSARLFHQIRTMGYISVPCTDGQHSAKPPSLFMIPDSNYDLFKI
jgi:hypothetical protein